MRLRGDLAALCIVAVAVAVAIVDNGDAALSPTSAATLQEDAWGPNVTFFILEPPIALQYLRGVHYKCVYFGPMYSFEFMFVEFLRRNSRFLAPSPEKADFVVLHHCVTYVYHVLRYALDYNTVQLAWEALRIVQEEYLLPMVRWAMSLPIYERFGGTNFVICFAMDKGRADYQLVSAHVSHWHAITTVGDPSWQRREQPWLPLARPRSPGPVRDPCRNRYLSDPSIIAHKTLSFLYQRHSSGRRRPLQRRDGVCCFSTLEARTAAPALLWTDL